MKIKLKNLKPGVYRPQSWLDKHPQHVEMQKKLKFDIDKNGMIDPLIVTDRNDGYYWVEKGNQRLEAISSMDSFNDESEIDCVLMANASKAQMKSSAAWDPDKVFDYLIPLPEEIDDGYDGYQDDGYE